MCIEYHNITRFCFYQKIRRYFEICQSLIYASIVCNYLKCADYKIMRWTHLVLNQIRDWVRWDWCGPTEAASSPKAFPFDDTFLKLIFLIVGASRDDVNLRSHLPLRGFCVTASIRERCFFKYFQTRFLIPNVKFLLEWAEVASWSKVICRIGME